MREKFSVDNIQFEVYDNINSEKYIESLVNSIRNYPEDDKVILFN